MEVEVEEWRDLRVPSLPISSMAIHESLGIAIIVRKTDEKSSEDVIEQVGVRSLWMGVVERRLSLGARVEGVAWVGEAAVLCTLDGRIAILSPHEEAVHWLQVSPSPLFAVAATSATQAVAISHSALLYYIDVHAKTVVRSISIGVESRLFSVTSLGDSVAIGGLDRIWIIDGKKEEREIALARNEQRLSTIVWCVAFVRKGLLASGDSTGTLSLWDTTNGHLITSLRRHEADILALAVAGGRIFASGVDPSMVIFEETNRGDWKDTVSKGLATRDVRSLATWAGRVFAAGADNQVYRVTPMPAVLPCQSNKSIDASGALSLVHDVTAVQVWSTRSSSSLRPPQFLALVNTPKKLPLQAAAISTDGSLVALSTREATTLYRIKTTGKQPSVSKVPLLSPLPPSTLLRFSDHQLFIVQGSQVWRLEADSSSSSPEIVYSSEEAGVVTSLAVSPSSLAVVTSRSLVYRVPLSSPSLASPLPVSLPMEVSFSSSESLFVLSSECPSPLSPSLHEFPSKSPRSSSSLSSRHFFPTGWISSLSSSPSGLLVASDFGEWALLSKGKIWTSSSSPSSKQSSFWRHVASVGASSDSTVRVSSSLLSSPSALPFKTAKYGMK